MQPLEIFFHEVDRSPALEAAIRARVEKLEKFADGITSCRVTVERPHRHSHRGNLYRVRVDVHVAGAEIVAGDGAAHDRSHENVYIAMSDAFAAARRQLQDHAHRQQSN